MDLNARVEMEAYWLGETFDVELKPLAEQVGDGSLALLVAKGAGQGQFLFAEHYQARIDYARKAMTAITNMQGLDFEKDGWQDGVPEPICVQVGSRVLQVSAGGKNEIDEAEKADDDTPISKEMSDF